MLCSRCGVTGSSVTAPGWASASSIAAAMAAPAALAPPSPAPLTPSEIERTRRVLGDQHLDRRDFARRRHEVIGEADAERLAARIVEKFFEQCAADALSDAAGDLAVDQHRIDRLADVVGDEKSLDSGRSGVAVDTHDGDVNAVGIVHMLLLEQTFGR